MSRRHTGPTIAEIAAAAGVSPGTVSKALNGRGQLRAQTRATIQRAADELGFRPAPYRRLAPDLRSYTVAVLTDDSFGRFSMPVMLGAESALGAGQISVMLCDDRGDPIRERHYLDMLHRRRVDGLIVTSRRTEARETLAGATSFPVVYTLTSSTDPDDVSVIADEEQGAREATTHLITTGRRSIAYVSGPQRHRSARLRADGVTNALRSTGAGGPVAVLWGEWSEFWGRQAAVILRDSHPDVNGVVCGNDQIARGLCDGLRDLGVRVPYDVAVIGFDNWDVIAMASRPPLTSVDLRLDEIGRVAATELLAKVEGHGSRGLIRVPTRLVLRESTGLG